VFVLVSLAVATPLHFLIAWRLARTGTTRRWRRGVWIGLSGAFVLMAATPLTWVLRGVHVPEAERPLLLWPSYVAMGLYSLVFTLWALRELGWLAARLLHALGLHFEVGPAQVLPEDPSRRAALAHGLNLGVLGLSGTLAGVGAYEARRRAEVRAVKVPIPELPASLHGFRVVQISDVHVGPTIRRDYLEPIVEAINGLRPDLVAITGDLVDGSVPFLAPHVAPLASLRARHGVFFCTGNHDYYSGVEPWLAHLQGMGIRTLVNQGELLEHDGGRVLIAGCTDQGVGARVPGHASDVAACVPDDAARGADARILLAHRPGSIFDAAQAGFHLQLSGHTHGGQFIPWNLVVKMVHPFSAGLDRYQDTWIYVNRGTGYFGPPVRLAVPSEITLLELVPA
jgi:predicted MPP superfamily phosphohydrolase